LLQNRLDKHYKTKYYNDDTEKRRRIKANHYIVLMRLFNKLLIFKEENKMKKRVLALLLAGIMLFALVSCGDKKNADETVYYKGTAQITSIEIEASFDDVCTMSVEFQGLGALAIEKEGE
jgi:hypothetical protein